MYVVRRLVTKMCREGNELQGSQPQIKFHGEEELKQFTDMKMHVD